MSSIHQVSTVDEFSANGRRIQFYSLPALQMSLGERAKISRLPISIRILLESLMRNKDGKSVTDADIETLAEWNSASPADREIPFKVGRVLMQDLTGVPALVDLAAMRDAASTLKLDPKIIEPEVPIDLVIDHSIQVDVFREPNAIQLNGKKEIERNQERYEFLKWAQQAFQKLKLVPPDTGICHQVNLEFLSSVVMEKETARGTPLAYPDTLVGTDSHTPMINGLGVLGWGVGGIEAEAALLGQPVTFLTPRVYGVHLVGGLKDGVTATDAVLTITQKMREIGVVGAFVEFFGEGVRGLTVAARATISNMSPEFGATCALFPVDDESLRYLRLTGRSEAHVEMVKKYFEAQDMFGVPDAGDIDYSEVIEIDLSQIQPSVAGPALPHERTDLANVGKHLREAFPTLSEPSKSIKVTYQQKEYTLKDGDVVIAAITSCTNTSNPSVMIAAGLLAKKAVDLGLEVQGAVKTSMAPGSMVVTEYLRSMGLLQYLEKLGFGVVGYGCTTCIAQGTPILLSNGTTRSIEAMATGNALLFGPTSRCKLGIARQSEFMKQGIRDCVKLILQDGRSLTCTPDHRILTSDGRWVRADELVPGKDRVVVGLEGPLDKPGEDEFDYVLRAGNLTFRMETEHERSRTLAFSRLLGNLSGARSMNVLGCGCMNVEGTVDREMVLNDIELITGRRPISSRCGKRKWSIVLPSSLTKAITSLQRVGLHTRIPQIPRLPSFLCDETCPVSIVREFLGGLFGADGRAPMLHHNEELRDSALEPPAYVFSARPFQLERSKKIIRELVQLLKRCGAETNVAKIHNYRMQSRGSTQTTAIDDLSRLEVTLVVDGLSFVERVGFRYCVDKMLRASAAAAYWRMVQDTCTQRPIGVQHANKMGQDEIELSFSNPRNTIASRMLRSSDRTSPPDGFSHHTSLGDRCRFSGPSNEAHESRPVRSSCNFSSPVELFEELGVRQWFSPDTTPDESPFGQCCVEEEVNVLPTFSLGIADRKAAGQRLVYDLAVDDLHAFVAGTVSVHNCIGNSGPLPEPVSKAIKDNNLTTAAVLSGNRNFEARIHQEVRANFLMSPPLVVAYALAGSVLKDLTREPLGMSKDGQPVFLKDVWPTNKQVSDYLTTISTQMFKRKYVEVYDQNSDWNKLPAPSGLKYEWDEKSTYIRQPPYFTDFREKLSSGQHNIEDIFGARPLLILGDYVTTDHISPAGAFSSKSVAGKYLTSLGVSEEDYNTYGSRRGNHLVMIRGTFANPRIKNMIVAGIEGAQTKHFPEGEIMSVYDASMKYQNEKTPLIVIAGKGFGTGSSRDWAAKGQKLLGVKAVVVESFERIHRSNLVGMGVLPLQLVEGVTVKSLNLDGSETFDITGLDEAIESGSMAKMTITKKTGEKVTIQLKVRIDSQVEKDYYKNGGILDYVLRMAVNRKTG